MVTQLTLRTHDLSAFFGAALGTIKAQSDAAFRRLIARFFNFYADKLFNPHWGEQIRLGPDAARTGAGHRQGLDQRSSRLDLAGLLRLAELATRIFVGSPFVGAFARCGGLSQPDALALVGSARRAGYHGVLARGGEVGAFLHGFESLWPPAVACAKRSGTRAPLGRCSLPTGRTKKVGLQFAKGRRRVGRNHRVGEDYGHQSGRDRGVRARRRGWRGPRYPGLARPPPMNSVAKAHAIDLAAAELRRIAPGAGSYVSESNYFNASWQDAFWGSNYPRLRESEGETRPRWPVLRAPRRRQRGMER